MKFLSMATVLILAAAIPAHAQKTVIIVHSSSAVKEMSAADVRAIFTGGDVHLGGSVHPIPILLRDGPVQESFLKEYIGKADASFRSGWRSLVFSGQANMPRNVEDEAEVVSYVARTPGAIGYVSRKAVHEGVLVVQVR